MDEISLCQNCSCMTKNVHKTLSSSIAFCGKCGCVKVVKCQKCGVSMVNSIDKITGEISKYLWQTTCGHSKNLRLSIG